MNGQLPTDVLTLCDGFVKVRPSPAAEGPGVLLHVGDQGIRLYGDEPEKLIRYVAQAAALPGLTGAITTQERERIVTELRNRAASERDEAFTARSNHAADRHIHAGAALDAAADDLLGGTADGAHTPGRAT